MKLLRFLSALLLTVTLSLANAGNLYHVAPNGTSGNPGTSANPWDLKSALTSGAHSISPGDTIRVHDGTYSNPTNGADGVVWNCTLSGNSSLPIVVRVYPGDRAILDGKNSQQNDILRVSSNYVWYWGLEVMSSDNGRIDQAPQTDANDLGSYPDINYIKRGQGINISSGGSPTGNVFIACTVHDCWGGFAATNCNDVNTKLYGCNFYNNGWYNSGGGGRTHHGHNIYIHNATGEVKQFYDCITWGAFENNIQAWSGSSTSADEINDFYFNGHISFLYGSQVDGDALLLGNVSPKNPTITNFMIYEPGSASPGIAFGYNQGSGTIAGGEISNNYVYAGELYFNCPTFTGTWSNNMMSSGYIRGTPYGSGTTGTTPSTNVVFVRKVAYDGRVNVVIYNWQNLSSVSGIDLSSAFSNGDTYSVIDVQNPTVVLATGTYSGPISIAMTGATVAGIVGNDTEGRTHTPSTFGVFQVIGGTVSTPSVPSAPTANAASNITTTSFTANWSFSSGATNYLMDVATDNGFTSLVSGYNDKSVGNVTSAAVTGLTSGTPYYYRIRASNSAGTSSSSNTVTVTTSSTPSAPAAPVATAATNDATTSFTANWNASINATAYLMDVATNSGFTSLVSGYSNLNVGNNTSVSVTGLAPNVLYYYRVRASGTGGTSGNSNTITVTTTNVAPSAPTANAASSITTISFTANWSTVSGANGYRLDVATNIGFTTYVSSYQNRDVSILTSFNVTGLVEGTTYYYRIRAYNLIGASASSNTVTVVTTTPSLPSVPTANAASGVGNTSFTANWSVTSGATGYRFDVATDAGFTVYVVGYQNLDVSNSTSRNVVGLSLGTTYYYRLRAYNAIGTSGNSNTVSTTTVGSSPPAIPVAISATSVASSAFTANWNSASGATGYQLDVSTLTMDSTFHIGDSVMVVLSTDCVNARTVPSITNSTAIFCEPAGRHGKIISGPSADVNGSSSATFWQIAYTDGVTGWSSAEYLTKLVGTFVSGYNNKDVGNVTSSTVQNLTAGAVYNYRVRAYNANGTSGNSNTITITTSSVVIQLPTGSLAVSPTTRVGAGTVNLIWVGNNATSANIDHGVGTVSASGGTLPVTVGIGTTTFTLTLTNASGSVVYTASVTVTAAIAPPTVITNPASSITTGSVQLNGSVNPNGAPASYHFDYGTTTGYGYATPTGSIKSGRAAVAIKASVTGLSVGKAYHFRASAANTGGASNGNDVTFTTASSNAIHIGSIVMIIATTDCASARNIASTTKSIVLKCEPALTFGTVVAGPSADVNGSSTGAWWKVTFSDGVSGWTMSKYLVAQ